MEVFTLRVLLIEKIKRTSTTSKTSFTQYEGNGFVLYLINNYGYSSFHNFTLNVLWLHI